MYIENYSYSSDFFPAKRLPKVHQKFELRLLNKVLLFA